MLVALVGCGDNPKLEIQVAPDARPEVKHLIDEAWPKVKRVCSGLDRYSKALTFKRIEGYDNATLVFEIPEQNSGIPSNYMADGHTCFFEISKDGKQVSIAKEGCKALCLDRRIEANEAIAHGDLILPL
jgi:hypothetical protein